MQPAPSTADMLSEMSACAYRLGMSFGREAEAAQETSRKLDMFRLFERCFFAVRVATALHLRLRREAGWAPAREPAGDAETLHERERAERERDDGLGDERLDADRDRETERASVPLFLNTLRDVAAEAAARPGPRPAELPVLEGLLARAEAPANARPGVSPLHDRLAGSAALAVTGLSPAPRPSPLLAARRATGPPRR